MSSTAYIVPLDTKVTAAQVLPNIDPLKLWSTTPGSGEKAPKVGTTRIFYNTPYDIKGPNVNLTALSSLGDGFGLKKGDARREIVRKAVGSAVKEVKNFGEGVQHAFVDASADPHASGEYLDANDRNQSHLYLYLNIYSRSRPLGVVQVLPQDLSASQFQ
jgi:aminopeptidase